MIQQQYELFFTCQNTGQHQSLGIAMGTSGFDAFEYGIYANQIQRPLGIGQVTAVNLMFGYRVMFGFSDGSAQDG